MSITMSLVPVSIDGVLPALPVIALELLFIMLQDSQMVVSLIVLVWCLASFCLARFAMPLGVGSRWLWGWECSALGL